MRRGGRRRGGSGGAWGHGNGKEDWAQGWVSLHYADGVSTQTAKNSVGPGQMGAEFALEFAAERARWLRLRFLWYCGIVGGLWLVLGVVRTKVLMDAVSLANWATVV